MKKSIVRIIIMLCAALFLAACVGQPVYYPGEEDHPPVEEPLVYEEEDDELEHIEPEPPATDKIAIITDEWSAHSHWVTEVANRHGHDNVIVYSWPRWRYGFPCDEAIGTINEIAANPEISVLIINPDYRDINELVDILRQQRDDIFVAIVGQINEEIALQADLILEFDYDAMRRAFPENAHALGADTLVFFYDGFIWDWDLDEPWEYEETYWHSFMREASAAAGLAFVEYNIAGEIQCGSSYGMFMGETVPYLLEAHGQDIVLFGLCNERVFWSWLGGGFIYLPLHTSWFQPDPIVIANELRVRDFFDDGRSSDASIAELIELIEEALGEMGQRGRVASWPMHTQELFALAAADYGSRRAHGDASEDGIALGLLLMIMTDLIEEYTGLQGQGVTMMLLEGNKVLVLPDYLIY